jgi:hypothetical protein
MAFERCLDQGTLTLSMDSCLDEFVAEWVVRWWIVIGGDGGWEGVHLKGVSCHRPLLSLPAVCGSSTLLYQCSLPGCSASPYTGQKPVVSSDIFVTVTKVTQHMVLRQSLHPTSQVRKNVSLPVRLIS